MNLYDKLKGFKAPELDDIGNMTVNEIIDILKSNVKHNAGVAKEVGKEAKITLKQEIDRINQLYQDVKGENSEFDNLIQTLEAQLTELKTKLEDDKNTEDNTKNGVKNNPDKYVIIDDLYSDFLDLFDVDSNDFIVVTIQLNQDSNQFEISFLTDVDIYDSEEIESFCEAAINDYKELQLIGPATFCYTYDEIFGEDDLNFNADEDCEPGQLEDMDTDEVINGMPFREFLEIIRDDVKENVLPQFFKEVNDTVKNR